MKTYQDLRKESAEKLPTYIVDIDGTLALRGERDPYDWSRVGEDLPNPPVAFVIQHLQLFSTIVIVSGREESCRWQTEMWLHAQGVFFHQLFMRPLKDNRSDWQIKREIYEQAILPRYSQIMGVFDDRVQVIERCWKPLGVFVFDVGNGRGNV